MTKIMEWAKEKHPHLIIVIENPVGTLKKMPLMEEPIMEEFTEKFGLYSTTVNYCAFGRDEMKPTVIWTNDWGLKTSLQILIQNWLIVGTNPPKLLNSQVRIVEWFLFEFHVDDRFIPHCDVSCPGSQIQDSTIVLDSEFCLLHLANFMVILISSSSVFGNMKIAGDTVCTV